jgi:DNA replication protein DnaC
VRLTNLLNEFAVAKDTGRFERVLAKYARYQLLIIDDWLLFNCDREERRDIYELIEARDELQSTIYCSQFSEDGWLSQLGKSASSEGVIARITKADVIRVNFSSKADMRAQRSMLLESSNQ